MAYATLTQLAERYGWTELTQLLVDEEDLVTESLLKDVVNLADLSSYTQAEIDAADVAIARVGDLTHKNSLLMDGKFLSVYALPLPNDTDVQKSVEDCCLALSRAALADDGDNLTKTMKEDRKYWREWLNEIAAGKSHLPGVTRVGIEGATQQRLTSGGRTATDLSDY
jgi:phage gp36-like protein